MASEEHKVLLKTIFKKYDKDGNGRIDASELESIFRDLRWRADAGSLNDALKVLDKDNSGTIEWDEFLKWTEFTWQSKVIEGANKMPSADLSYDTLKFVN